MPVERLESVTLTIEHNLKPIARLCIHFGSGQRKLSDMFKDSFVSVANEESKNRWKVINEYLSAPMSCQKTNRLEHTY